VAWLMAEGCSRTQKEEGEEQQQQQQQQHGTAWRGLLLFAHEKLHPPQTLTAGEFQSLSFCSGNLVRKGRSTYIELIEMLFRCRGALFVYRMSISIPCT
jgi:hypothetical protein